MPHKKPAPTPEQDPQITNYGGFEIAAVGLMTNDGIRLEEVEIRMVGQARFCMLNHSLGCTRFGVWVCWEHHVLPAAMLKAGQACIILKWPRSSLFR